ncbi:TRAP transporter large permease subunit, partial [Oscillibacter sp. UBA6647]
GVISHMFRDIAAKRPTISRVGLYTFADPRVEGGKLNTATTADIVELMELDGQEYLRYRHPESLDYAFLRGTYADERGNISMEEEACYLESIQAAQAVKNSGGTVFVQMKEVVSTGSLDMRRVRIPGALVDYVVPVSDHKNHMMTFDEQRNPAYCGNCRKVLHSGNDQVYLDTKKLISRRAAMEIVTNMGMGVGKIGAIAIMMVIVFIMGMFIDWAGIVMIVLPIFLPIMDQFGVDRLWLVGVTAVILQTCFMTPPFGFALFYIKGIVPESVTIQEIYRGVIPFIIIIVIVTILCIAFPQLVVGLPTMVSG